MSARRHLVWLAAALARGCALFLGGYALHRPVRHHVDSQTPGIVARELAAFWAYYLRAVAG